MHIVLPALGLVIIVLFFWYRLNPSSVSLTSFNPFLWQRRRAWAHRHRRSSVYALTEPMEVVGVLMIAVAKLGAGMSCKQKNIILDIFRGDFELDHVRSRALLTCSAKLLSRADNVHLDVSRVLLPCLEKFSTEMAVSTLQWLHDVAESDGQITPVQQNLLNQTYSVFDQHLHLKLRYNV